MTCRKCGSDQLTFTKHVHNGPKVGNSYHYRAHCLACTASYHIKRDKETYERVKHQTWQYRRKKGMRKNQKELGL